MKESKNYRESAKPKEAKPHLSKKALLARSIPFFAWCAGTIPASGVFLGYFNGNSAGLAPVFGLSLGAIIAGILYASWAVMSWCASHWDDQVWK